MCALTNTSAVDSAMSCIIAERGTVTPRPNSTLSQMEHADMGRLADVAVASIQEELVAFRLW